MSIESKIENTDGIRISPEEILREFDSLCIRFQWEWFLIDDAQKKANYTLKVKYSQYDL